MSLPRLAFAVLVFLTCATSAVQAEKRIALVMGNSAYTAAPLVNPKHDADLMASTLSDIGFEVIHQTDLTQRGMKAAIVDFGERLERAGKDAVGLVFYAGHGIQSSGRNYLIPVDATLEKESYLDIEAVPADWILGQMAQARNALNFLILDACRNNPFARSFRSAERGLARMDAPRGTLIAYSTKPGDVAADGTGRNSPYTKALSVVIRRPGLSASHMFIAARNRVLEETNEQQTPWEEGGLTAPFYFAGPGEAGGTSASADNDTLFWNSVEANPTPGAYQAYLEAYPAGRYAPLAKVRLKELEGAQVAVGVYPKAPKQLPTQATNQTPSQAPSQAPGTAFRDCPECPEMIVLPGGSFTMGSPSSEAGRNPDEGPTRRVTIGDGLAVGIHEVTRAEFAAFASATGFPEGNSCWTFENGDGRDRSGRSWRNPGYRQGDDDPVVCVSWEDARAYVEWLSRKTGERYRLLSEAEWEYAVRAGSDARYSFGDDLAGREICRHGNGADLAAKRRYSGWRVVDCDDGYVMTAPVGQLRANAFGLHDGHGNVWEWVDDCYHDSYAGAPSDGSARTGGGNCDRRVQRGGAWDSFPEFLRSAMRDKFQPGNRSVKVGFRVARGAPG